MEAQKIAFEKVTPARVRREAGPALLNMHRHVHGLDELGQVDCAELRRVHDILVEEMKHREMKHDSDLTCAEKAAGLYLQPPHGYLMWKDKKTAVAKSAHFVEQYGDRVVGAPLVVVSGDEAYGVVTLEGQPTKMTPSEFDRIEWFDQHRVRPEERREWWPNEKVLYVYRVKKWEPYREPRRVTVPQGTQNYMREVAFKEYVPPTARQRRLLSQAEKLPKTIILTPRAVSLTGSQVYGEHVARDTDLVMVGAEWRPEEERFVVPLTPTFKMKLERLLRAVFGIDNGVQYIEEGQGPTFDHLPLYSLALVRQPRLEIEHVSEGEPDFAELCYDKKALSASALERLLRGASAEVRRQAKVSFDRDEVKPGRPFVPLKPLRPAKESQRQLFSRFLEFVDSMDNWPLYVSAKRDGVRHTVHRAGGKVYVYSDDGADNADKLPELVERFEKFGKGDWVVDTEIEYWRDGQHYPREAAAGAVHSGQDTEHLVANIFRILYWDGEDLHAKPFSEVWSVMSKLPVDTKSDGALDPGKGRINLVPHYETKSLKELERRALATAYKPGVEGIVIKRADGIYPLDGEPGDPPSSLKWHKNAAFNVTVLEAVETRTAGVYNYVYGLPAGSRSPAHARELSGKTYLEIGKTFSTKIKKKPGDLIQVEAETVNETENKKDGTTDVSFWVPNFIQDAEVKQADSLDAVLKRAEEHGILQRKEVTEAGETEYLPTHPGKQATASKAVSLKYPPEDKKYPFVMQLHFRGRSVHGDFRASHGDTLEGWTIALQQPDAIKEPVETLAAAKKAASDSANWKMNLKTGEVKPRQIRGGTVRRGDLRAFPKATEIPKDWLGIEGVTDKPDPGEKPPVGATANFPGVFDIIQKGTVEHGAKKPFFVEYFLHGDTWGDQRWTFRMLGREEKGYTDPETGEAWEPEEPAIFQWFERDEDGWLVWPGEKQDTLPPGQEEEQPRSRVFWVLLQADPEPYVLSKSAIEKDWLPPKGTSALPKAIRDKIPEDLRYWKVGGQEALDRRRKLAELDIRELGGTETKADEKGIRPMFGSPGGKRALAQTIVGLIPEHKIYVEPFAGGAAVFFAKEPSEKEILADIDPDIAFAYQTVKNLTDAEIEKLNNKEWRIGQFEKVKASQPSDKLGRLHKWLYLRRMSQGALSGGPGRGRITEYGADWTGSKAERLPGIRERLKTATIKHADCKEVIKEADSPDTFFYLDPPYPGYAQGYQSDEWTEEDQAELFDLLKGLKGKFLLSLGAKSRGEVPSEFEVRIVSVGSVLSTGGHQSTAEQRKELLIANYTLPGRIQRKDYEAEPEEDEKAEGWHRYLLMRHWWRGPIIIRFGSSTEHYDLRVALDGKHWHLVTDGSPLEHDQLAAYEETKESGDVATADGKKISVMRIGTEPVELAPDQPANPTKDTPAFLQTVDEGQARVIGEAPEYKKLEFKGGKLKGAWIFRREEPGGDLGEFSKSGGPETKSTSDGGGPMYTYTCESCGKDFESEVPVEELACLDCEVLQGRGEVLEGEKAGRRLSGEKLGLLKEIRDSFDQLMKRLGELIKWGDYAEEQPFTFADLFKGDSGCAVKEVQGKPWFFSWSTNAFKDRQGEIFSTKALERYVLENEKKEDKGTFNFWHINDGEGTDFAQKQWQGVVGRFLVEAGPFLANHQGRSAKKFFAKYSSGHPEIAPEGWGGSPEYRFLPEERKTGIYDWVWINRTSALPRAAAANIWTEGTEVLTMALTDQQEKAAVALFGEDWVNKNLIEKGEQRTKELEEAGVAFKSAEEEAEDGEKAKAPEDEKPEEEMKAGLAKFKSALNEIAGMVKDDDATAKAIKDVAGKLTEGNMKDHGGTLKMLAGKLSGDLKTRLSKIADAMGGGEGYPAPKGEKGEDGQVEVELDIKALAELLGQQFKADTTPLAEALATVALGQKALEERLAKLEQTNALKQEAELPRFTFKMVERASEAEETAVKEEDPLRAMKPKETKPEKADGSYAGYYFGH